MTKLPNGPKTPALLQLIQWISDPLNYLETNAKQYGDMFTANMTGFPPFVMVSHPQAVRELFTADTQQFDAGRTNNLLGSLFGDRSIVMLDGDRHKRERKLLMPPFHGERLQTYAQSISNIAHKIGSQWQKNKPFIVRQAMQEITLEVIIQVVFGLKEGERYQQLKPLVTEMLDSLSSPFEASFMFFKFLQKPWIPGSPWRKMKQATKKIYALLAAEIEDRRNHPELMGDDILSLMMVARDEAGEPMSDQELKDEMMILLVAGHETTATTLAWAFYWVHHLPEVKNKLLEELANLGENPNPMTMAKLPYLSAVCQETLRIYPVGLLTFGRITNSPVSIMEHEFDPEIMLAGCIYLTHHREDLYPNSKQFKPERFLERQYSAYEFYPFGGGNRLCIGYALALLEMKLVLATILSNYELNLAPNQTVKPERRGFTLAPSGGVKMIMQGQKVTTKELVNVGG
ncbi:cytochrome P450 [Aphanothece sacrum]|uniref:Cytochrome P450 n=1 Tax=Aphanothece sacrum FPU1 TaxID=1920663 RepID=A0A401IE98_APHSA|nr:cytochrome P450 [Aphanothece sacrum]GBF79612.1 cytochrome P450 [Aphanothece sacrum FPU1]GBF87072.1 cytochrome P450 [Aphanothece sacrum FPU3]